MEVPMYRHPIPKPKDDGLISLRVPEFLKINPTVYNPETWTPTEWDLRNAVSENPAPSAMWRRDPKTKRAQSNSHVFRWSDGSLTMMVGGEHYEVSTKPLAPPRSKPYNDVQDAHYYAAAAHLTTNSLLIVGHFTEQYTVKPNEDVADHALEKLKAELASSKKERGSEMIIMTKEDPELQKKQAEMAERERLKAQRRRETASARVDGASSRYKGGALSIGDLEGSRRGAGAGGPGGSRGNKRGAPGGPKGKRRPEYDSDDDLPSGSRRPDSYDMDDGFLVDSDDDDEVDDDDDEEEELLDDDEDEDEAPRPKKQKTKASSRRRRHIIDDDDE
ncbi:Leo1-like protein-domain-containing protein [Bombardia bombarda]|uniref:Leo1-like protein-domain-containing protein n=1 Tax=Bombardia bombarda TaxID=252184 RepID=A0AA39WM16_9PEZI|nr:Leo1-like protein-domain-containing protein [Bombardia bombarda]